jgi:hypothetical protein
MRQFIDEHDLGPPGQNCINVHLLKYNPAIFLSPPGDNFQPFEKFGDIDPAMGLNESHGNVDPFISKLVRFLEHPVGLTNARGIT